jgi:hypothetical protein
MFSKKSRLNLSHICYSVQVEEVIGIMHKGGKQPPFCVLSGFSARPLLLRGHFGLLSPEN